MNFQEIPSNGSQDTAEKAQNFVLRVPLKESHRNQSQQHARKVREWYITTTTTTTVTIPS